MNPIVAAIPAFFLLMGVEYAIARAFRKREIYSFKDTMANLGCGILQQASGIFLRLPLFACFAWVRSRFGAFEWPESSAVTWIVAFVGVDFFYYWWHRASHRVNALWAAHVVHHQSDQFNLSVALRQSMITSLTSIPFYLPLALLGLPPKAFAAGVAFASLYQFWIHTRLIGKLGWLEWILNTPSHHRAHHGANPRYLDRNYGATLILWDRLFGTFAKETEPVVYGTVKPYLGLDPLRANIDYWVEIGRKMRAGGGLAALIAPPAWQPGEPLTWSEPLPEGGIIERNTPPRAGWLSIVRTVTLFGIALSLTLFLLHRSDVLPMPVELAGLLFVIGVYRRISYLLERTTPGHP